jgi:YkoY family integral membrane protein
MFHQTFQPHDLILIGVLIVLEGLLSMDNALVLGMLAARLPEAMRAKALTYGLLGALIFRIAALAAASVMLRSQMAEAIGGLYLVYVGVHHFWKKYRENRPARDRAGRPILLNEQTGQPLTERELGEEMAEQTHGQIRSRELDYSEITSTHRWAFWLVVAQIEFSDILFAVDSILAAIALVGPAPAGTPITQLHPKLWVVLVGGMGGVILMRWAAFVFIRLLARFPRFEISAYLMVILIGLKMLVDCGLNPDITAPKVNFHNPAEPIAWLFWGLMAGAAALGLFPARSSESKAV